MKTKPNISSSNSSKRVPVCSELQSRPDHEQSKQSQGTPEGGVIATSAVSAPVGDRPLSSINFDQRKENRSLPKDRVLSLLQRWLPRAYELAEVVGDWIWVTFTEPQPRELTFELSQLGFHWNSRRKTWQHPCGVFKTEPANPRTKYQSYHPADLKAA